MNYSTIPFLKIRKGTGQALRQGGGRGLCGTAYDS